MKKMTEYQLKVLKMLQKVNSRGAIGPWELSHLLQVNMQGIPQSCRSLERKGYVHSTFKNHKYIMWSISEKGTKFLEDNHSD